MGAACRPTSNVYVYLLTVRIAAAMLPLLDDNGTARLFNQAMIQNGTLTREQLQMLSLEEDCTCNVCLQHLGRAKVRPIRQKSPRTAWISARPLRFSLRNENNKQKQSSRHIVPNWIRVLD